MGLFDKKNCDICGGKIGLLGNRKLEDGNMCKDCAGLISPFMTDRRRTTQTEIREHLAYRENNQAKVTGFRLSRTLGDKTKIMLDESAGKFVVSSSGRWQSENPDVIDYSQVTGCQVDIEESRTEEKTKDREGKSISYNPPRYKYSYDFNVIIYVNSPWFNEIKFQINKDSPDRRGSMEYREYEREANEIRMALTGQGQQGGNVFAAQGGFAATDALTAAAAIAALKTPGGFAASAPGGFTATDALAAMKAQGGFNNQNSGGLTAPDALAVMKAQGGFYEQNSGGFTAPDALAAMKAPGGFAALQAARTCPHCDATTTPTADGRCEYCDGVV